MVQVSSLICQACRDKFQLIQTNSSADACVFQIQQNPLFFRISHTQVTNEELHLVLTFSHPLSEQTLQLFLRKKLTDLRVTNLVMDQHYRHEVVITNSSASASVILIKLIILQQISQQTGTLSFYNTQAIQSIYGVQLSDSLAAEGPEAHSYKFTVGPYIPISRSEEKVIKDLEQIMSTITKSEGMSGNILQAIRQLYLAAYLIKVYPVSIFLLLNVEFYIVNKMLLFLLASVSSQVYPNTGSIFYKPDEDFKITQRVFGAKVDAWAPDQYTSNFFQKLGLSSSFIVNCHVSLL